MFYKFENLENLDLSSFDSRNVIYMEQLFYGCKNLNNIKLSTNKTQNLRKYLTSFCENNIDVEKMFYGCEKLKEVKYK